jgi:hypothetical protein
MLIRAKINEARALWNTFIWLTLKITVEVTVLIRANLVIARVQYWTVYRMNGEIPIHSDGKAHARQQKDTVEK